MYVILRNIVSHHQVLMENVCVNLSTLKIQRNNVSCVQPQDVWIVRVKITAQYAMSKRVLSQILWVAYANAFQQSIWIMTAVHVNNVLHQSQDVSLVIMVLNAKLVTIQQVLILIHWMVHVSVFQTFLLLVDSVWNVRWYVNTATNVLRS